MRKHYMTLCLRNTEVTFVEKEKDIEVTFEQAVPKGFNELILSLNGNIVKNNGFNDSDVGYFKRFLEKNKNGISMEASDNAKTLYN